MRHGRWRREKECGHIECCVRAVYYARVRLPLSCERGTPVATPSALCCSRRHMCLDLLVLVLPAPYPIPYPLHPKASNLNPPWRVSRSPWCRPRAALPREEGRMRSARDVRSERGGERRERRGQGGGLRSERGEGCGERPGPGVSSINKELSDSEEKKKKKKIQGYFAHKNPPPRRTLQ